MSCHRDVNLFDPRNLSMGPKRPRCCPETAVCKNGPAGARQGGGRENITRRAGGPQASAQFCAKHARYFRVIRFPVWMTVGKQRAWTQRSMKLREAADAQYLEKSRLPVETCSPFFFFFPPLSEDKHP